VTTKATKTGVRGDATEHKQAGVASDDWARRIGDTRKKHTGLAERQTVAFAVDLAGLPQGRQSMVALSGTFRAQQPWDQTAHYIISGCTVSLWMAQPGWPRPIRLPDMLTPDVDYQGQHLLTASKRR
jgi:hypothetical protein